MKKLFNSRSKTVCRSKRSLWLRLTSATIIGVAIVTQSFANNIENKITEDNNYKFDDWVIAPECYKLSTETCNYLCGGYYLEPDYEYPLESTAETYPLEINSDAGQFQENGSSVFTGRVEAKQGNRSLYADRAEITQDKKTGELDFIRAKGRVKITEPGLRIDGSTAEFYAKQDKKTINNAKFRIYSSHIRGSSHHLTAIGKNLIYLPGSSFSTCPPNNNAWHLKASEIKLNRESGRGEAWHSRLYVKDVPIFYWPYVNFPIDNRRKTGFLFPEFKTSNNFGPTIKAPFYWNIAPNYDATITPYVSAKRNLRLLNEFRYLTDNSNGTILFDYLPKDKEYENWRAKKLAAGSSDALKVAALKDISQRYALSVKNKTFFTKDFDLEIDYSKLGDDNFLQQIGSEVLQNKNSLASTNAINAMQANTNTSNISQSTTSILQKLRLQYRSGFGTVSYLMQQYQTIHPFEGNSGSEQYRKLPELKFKSATFDLPLDVAWNFNSSYTAFKKRPDGASERDTVGQRFYAKPVLTRNFYDAGWFIKPSVKMHHVDYNLKLNTTDLNANKPKSPSRYIPVVDLDTGLIFERDIKIANDEYIQTFEPRAYFLYAPNREQENLPVFDSGLLSFSYDQLFRDNRYSGFDRQSEAKQVAISLSSKFLSDDTNEEKASISVGQLFYFRDRVIRTSVGETADIVRNQYKRSPIAAQAKYKIYADWSLEGNLTLDEPAKRIDLASIALQYLPTKYNVINLGYTFKRNDTIDSVTNDKSHLKQIHLSSAWFIANNLRAIGKVEYNLNRKNVINALAGLEHYGCCMNFRAFVGKRLTTAKTLTTPRRYNNEIGFQVIFKGFAGVGNADSAAISSGIPGYSAPKDNSFSSLTN